MASGAMRLALAAAILVVAGCASEADDWAKAQAQDSIAAYEKFVADHPDGAHAASAQATLARLRDDRAWKEASERDTVDALTEYADRHADGAHAAEAKGRIAELVDDAEWKRASDAGAIPAFEAYLQERPEGRHVQEANRRLAELCEARDWDAAAKADSIEAYENFLKSYPEAAKVRTRLLALREAQERERLAKIEKQAWDTAVAAGTAEAVKKFLDAHPDSERAPEASKRLAALQEKEAWNKTKLLDSVMLYQMFVNEFPDSTHVDEANARLGVLRAAAEVGKLAAKTVAEFVAMTLKTSAYPRSVMFGTSENGKFRCILVRGTIMLSNFAQATKKVVGGKQVTTRVLKIPAGRCTVHKGGRVKFSDLTVVELDGKKYEYFMWTWRPKK